MARKRRFLLLLSVSDHPLLAAIPRTGEESECAANWKDDPLVERLGFVDDIGSGHFKLKWMPWNLFETAPHMDGSQSRNSEGGVSRGTDWTHFPRWLKICTIAPIAEWYP